MLNKINKSILLRLLLATFFFIPLSLSSQTTQKKTRILFLLDASSSMTYSWNESNTRFEVASNILLKIMDSVYKINNEIEFAVRAYGTMYAAQEHNCIDTKLEVPFNLQNTNQIKTRLHNLKPIGSSPIAYSLTQAADNELSEENVYDYSVIFITDGGESCNGDVCKIYQKLLQRKISITPYIIGLDSNETLKSYYACLGNYLEVHHAEDIDKAVQLIVDANHSIIDKPKQLNLVTTFANAPVIKDSVKKDTALTKPVVKQIPEVKRDRGLFPWLILQNIPPQKNAMASVKSAPSHLKKIKQVSLRFSVEETKKESRIGDQLIPALIQLKHGKPSLVAKKTKIKSGKAVLHFEYEEPKKVSPTLVLLKPKYPIRKTKKSSASLLAKKSNLKAAKAILHFEYEEPKKLSPVLVWMAPAYQTIRLKKSKASLLAKKSNLKKENSVKLAFEYELPKREPLAAIKIMKFPRRYTYAYKMPDTRKLEGLLTRWSKQKAVLHFAVEEKKAVAKKDTVLAAPPAFPMNNSVEFSTEVKADKETMVKVYFKGTNGKTYPTAKPMILLQDVNTNATVTSFKRDMNGEDPIPQSVLPGTYNLVIKGFDDLYANNIKIEPHTVTSVTIKVSDGTLKFAYMGNFKRPMVEYSAIVNRRFAAGATVKQKCSESKTYEPGTYYVEINCLPPYKSSIDITFGASFEIQIGEPGTLMIMNNKPLGKVQIQSMLGDKYATFHTMEITGNPAEQKVQLLPYQFKLIYPADPNNPAAGMKELPVKINSNVQTELELK